MKRRKFLISLGVVPPLVIASCEKDFPLPTTLTIINGKVIDENNMPVKDWGFTFSGYDATRIPNVNTFAENTLTNKDGIYNFSLVIPQSTSYINFNPIGIIENGAISEKTLLYKIFFERDGKYIPFNSSAPNPTPKIGESNTINFQIIKK